MGWICFVTLMVIRLSVSLNFCPIAETVMQSLGSGRSQRSHLDEVFLFIRAEISRCHSGLWLGRAERRCLGKRKILKMWEDPLMRGTWKSYFEITGVYKFTQVLKGVWDSSSPSIYATAPAFWGRRWFALQEEERACFCLNVVVSGYSALQMSNSDIPVSQYSSKTLRFPLSF